MGAHTRPYYHSRSISISSRYNARLRQVVVVSVLCLAIYCFLLAPEKTLDSPRASNPEAYESASRPPKTRPSRPEKHEYADAEKLPPPGPELLENRFLSEDQCRVHFPGLLKEVDDEVARGEFRLERNPYNRGPLIARIRDGQLYILLAAPKSELSRDMLAHRSATLQQIANALLTWPYSSSSSPPSSTSSKGPYAHIPNTLLAFNHHDDPIVSTLSYARPADPSLLKDEKTGALRRFFAIPHFSFYAWDLPFIGSLYSAAKSITALEAATPFAAKIPRAVWRGTSWFNNPRAAALRANLVKAFGSSPSSKEGGEEEEHRGGPPWADIQALEWNSGEPGSDTRNASNALNIADFCAYKYIVFTEGITYSGRFQYHTLCESVVLTPPISWMQHLTHLVRPVFTYTLDLESPDLPPPPSEKPPSSPPSSPPLSFKTRRRSLFFDLLFGSSKPDASAGEKNGDKKGASTKGPGLPRTPINLGSGKNPFIKRLAPYPADWVREAWPAEYGAGEANMVFVAPDWSDLEATVAWLEAHPNAAAGIAARQRRLFHGRGYLSPAAEMCYWRAVIQGWSEVARFDDAEFADLVEVPWEEFSLKEIHM